MTTPAKADHRTSHKRLQAVIAKQIKTLWRKQRDGKFLDEEEIRQLKLLSDALNDSIKTSRLLDQDEERAAHALSDQALEAIAGVEKPPQKPRQHRRALLTGE